MKVCKRIALIGVACLVLAGACSSQPKVVRGEANDLSGYWSSTDVREVCTSLIDQCLGSQRVNERIDVLGRIPQVIVGSFKNDSDEHIDTAIIAENMEIALGNSGTFRFVAGGDVRQDLRAERQDQQSNASEKTAAALGNETGADFMLSGSVRTIVDRAGNKSTRTYYVKAVLTNIETNQQLWSGNSEISKTITLPKSRL
jgi:uncharacterized protein (TIGR02722 family)